jgi:Ca2+/Na+ antiporter
MMHGGLSLLLRWWLWRGLELVGGCRQRVGIGIVAGHHLGTLYHHDGSGKTTFRGEHRRHLLLVMVLLLLLLLLLAMMQMLRGMMMWVLLLLLLLVILGKGRDIIPAHGKGHRHA